MILEEDEWDTTVRGLKARDPRLTKSHPNLLQIEPDASETKAKMEAAAS